MNQDSAASSIAMSQVRHEVQALLMGDAGALISGVILCVIGLSAISAFWMRRRPRAGLLAALVRPDRTAVWDAHIFKN